jgi:hypothetical protein
MRVFKGGAPWGTLKDDEPIRPMTLGNMRQHCVRGLFVVCRHCSHERAVNMDDWPDDATVPSFGPRMRCSRCGKLGATAVPNWIEQADRLPGGSRLSLSMLIEGKAAIIEQET